MPGGCSATRFSLEGPSTVLPSGEGLGGGLGPEVRAGGNSRQTFRIFLILDYHFLAYGGANKPGLLFFIV